MKKIHYYATCLYKNSIATIVYEEKKHGQMGMSFYPRLGDSEVKSGETAASLRQLIKDLKMPIDIDLPSGGQKDGKTLGDQIIAYINSEK